MKQDIYQDSKKMKKAFDLSVDEIEKVLDRKKPITDITKLAGVTLAAYSRVKSTEMHDKALEIMLTKIGSGNLPGVLKAIE